MPCSHAWSAATSRLGTPMTERPSGVNGCSQIATGAPTALPSFFHNRLDLPVASGTTLGAMSPPKGVWQTIGQTDRSTHGPAGRRDAPLPDQSTGDAPTP